MGRAIAALWVVVWGLAWAKDNTFSLQLNAGWFNGLSGEVGLGLFNIAGEKLGVRLGLAYSQADAVDNNVFAPSSENAQNLTLGLDVSYSFDFQSAFTLSPYLGFRYNLFSGSVTVGSSTNALASNQFGLGGGVRAGYFLDSQLGLLLDLGLDYFFESSIQLGSTRYNPGETSGPPLNLNVHQWVNDPRLVWKGRLGLAFNF
ncbi:MAG: outer membrane beta-barrel protein [Meiothermus sp.]|uniref:outer membrane beta-barrel protein n=1 Tax=Meiothermus sp. TaxID=1955249 RepID=UPI0025CDDFBB|nr:outer membrane beta-barrel protein [Meiothermus sp.]MCS7069815.1 outer membrane beta-barrel protein [Meiothermus sp.]